MAINAFIVSTSNVLLQTVAYILLLAGVAFARKRNFHYHGILMNGATLLVLVSLAVVMLPIFYSVIISASLASLTSLDTNFIIILHHSLGVIAIVMALIAITVLRPCGSVMGNQKLGNVRKYMISLFTVWSITYFLGVIVYLILYFNF